MTMTDPDAAGTMPHSPCVLLSSLQRSCGYVAVDRDDRFHRWR
jgi:hypothetical protein